jgi:hypothetical protein
MPPENISQWERQSAPLRVSNSYSLLFKDFTQYFSNEMKAVDDNTLNQEMTILYRLSMAR